MLLNSVPIEYMALGLVVANLVIGLLYVKHVRGKASRNKVAAHKISMAIIDYFRRSGVEVAVGCTSLDGDRRYTAFIESEPMKRFRLSHIIEATLSEHVLKTCNLELEKIYWRFPIKEGALIRAEPDEAPRAAPSAAAVKAGPAAETAPGKAEAPAEVTDEYINEGLVHYQHLPKVEVTELSWEKFQEVSTAEAGKKTPV